MVLVLFVNDMYKGVEICPHLFMQIHNLHILRCIPLVCKLFANSFSCTERKCKLFANCILVLFTTLFATFAPKSQKRIVNANSIHTWNSFKTSAECSANGLMASN